MKQDFYDACVIFFVMLHGSYAHYMKWWKICAKNETEIKKKDIKLNKFAKNIYENTNLFILTNMHQAKKNLTKPHIKTTRKKQ